MKYFLFLSICLFSLPGYSQKAENSIKRDDVMLLVGNPWKGKLTFGDFSTNVITTVPVNLTVSRNGENVFIFTNTFPRDPSSDYTDTLELNKTGTMLGDQSVMQRAEKGDTIVVVTDKSVKDSTGKGMQYRYTYKILSTYLAVTKIERNTDSTEFKVRQRYLFTR